MNNLDQIIRSRRAIYPKQFENGDISKNTLLNILDNGNMAPSHGSRSHGYSKIFNPHQK